MDRTAVLLFCIVVYSISGLMMSGQLPSSPALNFNIGPPPSAPSSSYNPIEWGFYIGAWAGYIGGVISQFVVVTFDLIGLVAQAMTFSWIPVAELRFLLSFIFGILFFYGAYPAIQKIVEIIVEAIPL